ncbi:MAG TPA: TetR/AcrR family transcriptional regulator [Pseudolysinimonas sp.]|nr:TetR/AcrR family transcriptional regulator [Pseudolysinimonas sp.]
MSTTHVPTTRTDTVGLIRNEPVQARSTARLAALLDAAAEVISEIGYERLTTAMVAERAGASIGTVYRYFPDRIAVLQSLAARNLERSTKIVLDAIADESHVDWYAAFAGSMRAFTYEFRDEPGFASLRFGDVLDLRPSQGAPANEIVADLMFDAIVKRFGVSGSDDARLAFQVSFELGDSLVARAFARDPEGLSAILYLAAKAADALMSEYWGPHEPSDL